MISNIATPRIVVRRIARAATQRHFRAFRGAFLPRRNGFLTLLRFPCHTERGPHD